MDADRTTIAFGEFTIELADRRLLRHGVPIELGSRYFDALVLMARQPGQLVTKDRFMDEVWCGVPVTDEALTQCIRTLRRTLGDSATAPAYIETVPKHGYRLLVVPVAVSPALAERHESARIAAQAALGGMAAGTVGGAVYGLLALSGGGAEPGAVLVLTLLGAALGFLGGAGAGAGAALVKMWRDAAWLRIAGGGFGGLAIGAIGSALGRDGVAVIAGVRLGDVTGMFEGLVLGCAAGMALVAGEKPLRRGLALAGASGLLAGALVMAGGGHLFADSLVALERGVAGSRLGLAQALGQLGYWTPMIEAGLFALAIAFVRSIGFTRKGAARPCRTAPSS